MIQEIKSVEFVYKGKIEVDNVTKNKRVLEKSKKRKGFSSRKSNTEYIKSNNK